MVESPTRISFKMLDKLLNKKNKSMFLKCGPNCPIYDVAMHQCGISKKIKKSNLPCDFKYTIVEGPSIAKLLK